MGKVALEGARSTSAGGKATMVNVALGELCAAAALVVWMWLMFRSSSTIRHSLHHLRHDSEGSLPLVVATTPQESAEEVDAGPVVPAAEKEQTTPRVKARAAPLAASDAIPEGAPRAADISGATPGRYRRHEPLSSLPYRTVVVFLSGTGAAVDRIWDALRADPPLPDGLRLLCVTRGPKSDPVRQLRLRLPRRFTVIQSDDAWLEYGIRDAPTAVFVDGGYVTGTQYLHGWGDVDLLVARHMETVTHGPLPDVQAEIDRVSLEQFADLPLVQATTDLAGLPLRQKDVVEPQE